MTMAQTHGIRPPSALQGVAGFILLFGVVLLYAIFCNKSSFMIGSASKSLQIYGTTQDSQAEFHNDSTREIGSTLPLPRGVDYTEPTAYNDTIPPLSETTEHTADAGRELYNVSDVSPGSTNGSCAILRDEISVVTAFFYLGEAFPKGGSNRNSSVYFEWMKAYQFIASPVSAFFNRKNDAEYFGSLRSSFPKKLTKITVLDMADMWAFKLAERAKQIVKTSQSNKTAQRASQRIMYNSVQHAKYELLLNVSTVNPFCTKYVIWLDIGFFLGLVKTNPSPFPLWLPPTFNDSSISYTEVRPKNPEFGPADPIVKGGCWVCGGAVLATVEVMKVWAGQYMTYTEELLEQYGTLRTDQQNVYSMDLKGVSNISIKTFSGNGGGGNRWRTLGYLCKKYGIMRANSQLLA